MINKDTMKKVLKNEKRFLKMSEVRFSVAPAFDEIGVKHLYKDALAMDGMA